MSGFFMRTHVNVIRLIFHEYLSGRAIRKAVAKALSGVGE